MSESIPRTVRSDRPNLQQKRKLAKELLKSVRRLDGKDAARFTWNHPRFRGKSADDVIRAGVTLVAAQHVVARESGFESWPKLVDYVRLLEIEPAGPTATFESAVTAIIRGDEEGLRLILKQHPEVATMRSMRHHHCVLPHYIAANGVENEHQVVPPNAPRIARILFDAGANAVVDATADIYGGGAGSTPLVALVTSVHPHQAGVQADLVRVFCDAGANPNGLETTCRPLSMALGFRYPKAAEALAECGASIDNLSAAAALGRLDLVREFLDESLQHVSQACTFPNPGYEEFSRSTAPHPPETMRQALVFACMCGHLDVAQLLLEQGVDINGGPRRGITALHETCYQGLGESAHWLVAHGADPTLRDQMWNSTAIGWADGGNHPELIAWLLTLDQVDIQDAVEQRQYKIVARLLHRDPQLVHATDGRDSVLCCAAQQGDLKMVHLLLDHDADPMWCNENGHSALDYAEKNGHRDVLQRLQSAIERQRKEGR